MEQISSMNSEQSRSPHWPGEQKDEYIKREKDGVHISAKALAIVWGNDHRFWQWTTLPEDESCFKIGAELIQVNWIEVTGSLDLEKYPLDSLKTYELIFLMKYKVDSFGWHSSPITFEVSVPDLEQSHRKYGRTQVLEHYSNASGHQQLLEVHGVDFSLSSSSSSSLSSSSSSPISSMGKRIEFSMKEVKTHWWKGGVVLEGVKIRPKSAKH